MCHFHVCASQYHSISAQSNRKNYRAQFRQPQRSLFARTVSQMYASFVKKIWPAYFNVRAIFWLFLSSWSDFILFFQRGFLCDARLKVPSMLLIMSVLKGGSISHPIFRRATWVSLYYMRCNNGITRCVNGYFHPIYFTIPIFPSSCYMASLI